jgi:hypothetical protein
MRHSPRLRCLLGPLVGLGLALALGLLAGCGREIGDACATSLDCSTNGERSCDSTLPDGYCTVQGCDYNTCPDGSACVRFFTGTFVNRPCSYLDEDSGGAGARDDCSHDEVCALSGSCVLRSSEVRYCMRLCGSASDCRDGYECRDLELMKAHGGEPVLAEAARVVEGMRGIPRFCGAAPR